MYGTQTSLSSETARLAFENDVKMYGTQTPIRPAKDLLRFENDVKMYGTQTNTELLLQNLRLRMM